MSETSPFGDKSEGMIRGANAYTGETDYEVRYRLPAREDWEEGDEVGFIEADDWMFWVAWKDDELQFPLMAFPPGWSGIFPGATKLMITDNSAIGHGI